MVRRPLRKGDKVVYIGHTSSCNGMMCDRISNLALMSKRFKIIRFLSNRMLVEIKKPKLANKWEFTSHLSRYVRNGK